MNNPFVSVVMPVYNGEKYLREAIDSVLNQSFSDFEFIIINDGSTDSTESIILSYVDERIKYIKQKNFGVGSSLRIGCNLAKGKYIARMDADDICFPERFAIEIAYLQKNRATVLVSSAVRYINENGDDIGRSFPYTKNFAIKKRIESYNPICHPCVMMRRSAYELSNGYLNVQPFEDRILWLSLLKQGKLYNFRFPLLKYRILSNSISRSISLNQKKQLFAYLKAMINNNHLSKNEIDEYNRHYLKAKLKAIEGINEEELKITGIKNYSLSKNQHKIYHFLREIGIKESVIELFICTLKNYFILFK